MAMNKYLKNLLKRKEFLFDILFHNNEDEYDDEE